MNKMDESLLTINGATRINGNTDILVERIIVGAKDIGLNPVLMEMFFFSNIMGKGAVSSKPDYLDQAYKIGTNLVKYNEIRD